MKIITKISLILKQWRFIMKQLLFLAAMICGIAAFAGDLDINGDFKKVKGTMPLGWTQNKGSWAKPFGAVELLKSDKGNALKITSAKETKATHVYSTKAIPVKAGDKVKVTIKLKGKGKAGGGVYAYGAKKWCFGSYKSTGLKPETTEFTNIITIKDRKKDGKVTVVATKCKVVLEAKANTEAIFESVKIEVIPAK
jgi:hypothetical protein